MTSTLYQHNIRTPLGLMLAIASEEALCVLAFAERSTLKGEINRLTLKNKTTLISRITAPIQLIENELKCYFEGSLTTFKTPLCLRGTPFQKRVWEELTHIPFGTTRSYIEMAKLIDHPTAFRAVASANRANPLAIIIPCHRVIKADGSLCGYNGGVAKKKWLLEHELKR